MEGFKPKKTDIEESKKLKKIDKISKQGMVAMGGILATAGIIQNPDVLKPNDSIQESFTIEQLHKVKDSLEESVTMPIEEVSEILERNKEAGLRKEIIIEDPYNFRTVKPEKPFYYKDIHSPDVFENLQLPGQIGRFGIDKNEGKMLLALRFKPIVDAVEARYKDFPEELKGVLIAQIMKESTGLLYLPNALGDGGFGVIHMQGLTAHEFGLHTYANCDAMVCDGKNSRSCKDEHGNKQNHAASVKWIIDSGKYSRGEMAKKDERLDPILNIDAAARMLLAYYYAKPKAGYTREQSAIMRYSGSVNYEDYKSSLDKFSNILRNKSEVKKAREYFNSINSDFTINGEKADFDMYLESNYRLLQNFGLEEYKELPQVSFQPEKQEVKKKA